MDKLMVNKILGGGFKGVIQLNVCRKYGAGNRVIVNNC